MTTKSKVPQNLAILNGFVASATLLKLAMTTTQEISYVDPICMKRQVVQISFPRVRHNMTLPVKIYDGSATFRPVLLHNPHEYRVDLLPRVGLVLKTTAFDSNCRAECFLRR